MIKALFALSLSAVAGFTLACAIAATPEPAAAPSPSYQVIATDSHGESFIAGTGDDCTAAWKGAVLPSDWRDIICIESR